MNTYSTSDDEGSKRSEQATPFATFIGRVLITLAVALMGFGGFGTMIATAEAPDQLALAKLNQGIENYFVIQSHELLTRDERAAYIAAYFEQRNLPAADYADDFVVYAEIYNLDWRLLPAIAQIESTGCRYTLNNHAITKRKMNCFGYGSMSFESIEEGIAYIAKSLAGENPNTAQYYAGKDLKTKLYAYNSVIPHYYEDITGVMQKIYDQKELFKKSVERPNA